MRQQRSYVQPSCILQVWWDSWGLVNDRVAVQQLGFVLSFNDQQTLAGDLGQLWTLVNSIDAYIQKFLSQDYLPTIVHGVMGLRLTSGQLVDASNAIEQLRGEVLLLPASPISYDSSAWLKSLGVGVCALTIGAGIGLWLASRQSRLQPSVVVAPPPPPEVFTDAPPPAQLPPVQPPEPSITPPPKQSLPPITVNQRPPAPPPLEKTKPPLPAIVEETPPDDRELVLPQAPTAGRAARNESLFEADSQKPPPSLTIENVEISTSELLTDDLINYLRSVALPQGRVTIDVTVEEGKAGIPSIENASPEASTTLSKLLENWIPPERSGRVRVEVSVP